MLRHAPLWAWSLCLLLMMCAKSANGQNSSDCSEPPTISHGHLPSSLQPPGPPYQNGSTLFYVCYPEYQLHGAPDSLTCVDGAWVGDMPYCLELECSDPSSNPDIPSYSKVISTGPYVNGSWAVFQCNYGHRLNRDFCNNYQCWLGSWRWVGQRCSCNLMQCLDPPSVDNGYFTPSPPYQQNRIIQYSCNTGFTLRHNTGSLTCSLEYWIGNFPVCDTQYCSEPPAIGNGYVATYGPYTHESHAAYSCNAGYTMKGQADIKCQGGAWIGTPPECNIIDRTTVTIGAGFPFWMLVTLLSVLLFLALFGLIYLCCICCCYDRCCRRKHVRPYTPPREYEPDTVKIVEHS